MTSIMIFVLLVILPLVAFPAPGRLAFSIAAATCTAASILLLAYPFAILDHSAFGGQRKAKALHKGEPVERIIVVLAGVIAAVIFAAIIWSWQN